MGHADSWCNEEPGGYFAIECIWTDDTWFDILYLMPLHFEMCM